MTDSNTPTSPIPLTRPTISTLNHLSAAGTRPHTTAIIYIRTIFPAAEPTFLADFIDSPYNSEGLLYHEPDLEHDEGEIHRYVLQGYERPKQVYEGNIQIFEAEFEITGSDSVGLCWAIVGKGKVRIRIEGEDTDPAFSVEGRKTLFGAGVSVFECTLVG
ncbi:MAG: hypothetical protein Q9199_003393 [Rusavskia elegans]